MINQVTLVGRLTKDPDLRVTPEGVYVCNIILAVNRQYRNQKGEVDTDFVHCTLWRKTAENTTAFCKKGSLIGITGRIQTRSYDQQGKRTYVTEVVAENVRFIGPKREDERVAKIPFPTPSPEREVVNP
ncbi:single-strand binding protein Ssb [Mycobacteroides abscessus subsp. abscessus]|nr:single-strand binding protein Ssb [Mycobacteroides abscessus subsp. abscessus]